MDQQTKPKKFVSAEGESRRGESSDDVNDSDGGM